MALGLFSEWPAFKPKGLTSSPFCFEVITCPFSQDKVALLFWLGGWGDGDSSTPSVSCCGDSFRRPVGNQRPGSGKERNRVVCACVLF